VLDDYKAHLQTCSLFMGDLLELFRQRPEQDREDIIDAWLKGRVAAQDELEECQGCPVLPAQRRVISPQATSQKDSAVSVVFPVTSLAFVRF